MYGIARRSTPRHSRRAGTIFSVKTSVTGVCLAAVLYNAFLALLGAHFIPMSYGIVVATEGLILACGLMIVIRYGITETDFLPIAFLLTSCVLAMWVGIFSEAVPTEGIRNALVISIFYCLGTRTRIETTDKIFITCAIIVAIFLALEVTSLESYAWLLKPAQYYAATRGIAEFSLNETGLFANALGFEGRFTWGIYSGPRTSSIFLEQVSLANFAAVLSIYVLCRWRALKPATRAFLVTLILIVLITNNTRTTSALCGVFLIGYFLFHKVPRGSQFLIIPSLLALGFILSAILGASTGDDIAGRLSLTISKLWSLDFGSMFVGNLDAARRSMDSGYPFVIFSTTVAGLFALWMFISLSCPSPKVSSRVCGLAISLFFGINLLIGGTAVFSIKIAALLWLLAGSLQNGWREQGRRSTSADGSGRHSTHSFQARLLR
ncbi:hypothetical protein SAMN03159496_04502 [Rhizobium sp. NFR07]|uniref:hypothetical protein n=1 Tax=Rhizobium sp. NFR07 TaxID=1566262 RepID=UPI0008E01D01|nr:hypothetical protein [Rhizobium sp. NFR07]SFB51035.1 hypothetical protein SAMN03159496_04502 [Rhizobium sp. NFR07]